MKRILLLAEHYRPTPHATAVCAEHVLAHLSEKHGIAADVLCFTSQEHPAEPSCPDMRILSVPREKKSASRSGKIAAIEGLLCLPWFPMQTVARVRDWLRYRRAATRALQSGEYAAVIAAFHPYESAMALSAARRAAPQVCRLLWCLDPASYDAMERRKKHPLRELHRRLYFYRERRIFSDAEHILLMACSRLHYTHPRYDRFREKFRAVDLPLLDLGKAEAVISEHTETADHPVRVLYAGRFYGAARNPKRYLSLLPLLPKALSVQSDFYTDGSEDTALRSMAEQGFCVCAHPMIARDLLQRVIDEADVHLSFGNRDQEIVPSKLFESMSTAKRILHFAKDETDSAMPYLSEYPAALVITDAEDDVSAAERLSAFLQTPIPVDKQQLAARFPANTPDFTADVIAAVLTASDRADA